MHLNRHLAQTTASATAAVPSFGKSSSSGPASTTNSAAFPGFALSSSEASKTTAAPSIFGSTSSSALTSSASSAAPVSFTISTSSSSAQASSANAAGTTSGSTTTTITPTVRTPQMPSEITGKTIEEIIKDWNSELQEQTTKFRKQAEAIAEWDRRILRNRNILIKLESEAAKVVESQHSLERQLELIETHQQEVEKALQSMEGQAERIYKEERPRIIEDQAASVRDNIANLGTFHLVVTSTMMYMMEAQNIFCTSQFGNISFSGDLDNDVHDGSSESTLKKYEQAEYIERELEQMGDHIKGIIQTVNANQGGDMDTTDGVSPLDIVVRILNNQLNALVWIDEKAGELSTRINKLSDHGAALDRTLPRSRYWIG
ncbi:hypothetical protein SUGI_0339640 [Cryptomeria japonica]|nr:hypothetical protein SUGI_0339640 [Cryptomeria japonica]